MSDIIPFPIGRRSTPPSESGGEKPVRQTADLLVGSLAQGVTGRLEKMMEEIVELYEDSSVADYASYRFDMRDVEADAETAEADLALVTELVVFSPEVQQCERQATETETGGPRVVQWGDVFFKSGDEYPFLFTVYTEGYVKHQLRVQGEKIMPSPRDIIRAVLKWVNLYAPEHRGKPVRLESDEVVRDLVCEPGIEVLVSEPS